MNKIDLTIQFQGKNKRWRLGIPVSESKNIFKKRGKSLKIKIPSFGVISTKTKCGCVDFSSKSTIRKKGYDLYEPAIHSWINSNGWVNPQKITFVWNARKGILTFVKLKK